jgi:hypothetical protein
MKKTTSTLLFLALCCLSVGLFAQEATVNHGVSLRGDPSTKNAPIGHLNRSETVTLLSAKPRRGFYHIKIDDGTEGWVGIKYLNVESSDTAAPPATPTTTGPTATSGSAPTSDADLLNMLFAAHTKAVGQPLVVNQHTVCGPEGDATNPKIQALNDNKNRTDTPSNYITVSWDQIKNLPNNRANDLQGAPVTVVGFLSHRINVESNGSGESTNCHLLDPDEVDWHIYLTESPAQGIKDAVIVETTPRTRPAHKWTTAMLKPLVDSNTQVRVSGWLIFDAEHLNVVGKQRATVWEVHPITKIEVQKNGQWVDLDGSP